MSARHCGLPGCRVCGPVPWRESLESARLRGDAYRAYRALGFGAAEALRRARGAGWPSPETAAPWYRDRVRVKRRARRILGDGFETTRAQRIRARAVLAAELARPEPGR